MRSIIKWGATTLSRVARAGKPPTQQVSYLGKAANVTTWTPYGFDAAPPKDKLALILAILSNSDNQVGLVGSPGEGPTLADGEVVTYHPTTGAKVHFRADGSIEIVTALASVILSATGDITATCLNAIISASLTATVTAPLITLDGNVAVTGTLAVAGASASLPAVVTSGSKAIGAAHTHGGVTTGAGSTGVPD